MIQSRFFLLRDNNFIHCELSDLTLQEVFIHLELCEKLYMKGHFQKSIKGAL